MEWNVGRFRDASVGGKFGVSQTHKKKSQKQKAKVIQNQVASIDGDMFFSSPRRFMEHPAVH